MRKREKRREKWLACLVKEFDFPKITVVSLHFRYVNSLVKLQLRVYELVRTSST